MTIHAERDAFTVAFDSARVGTDAMLAAVKKLGYRPRVAASSLESDDPSDVPGAAVPGEIPEPIRSALTRPDPRERFLLVDFHASWCAPCKVIERIIFSNPETMARLEAFAPVKVDTDRFPEAAKHFGVKALPTLLVLDRQGTVLYRHVGPITPKQLVEDLDSLGPK